MKASPASHAANIAMCKIIVRSPQLASFSWPLISAVWSKLRQRSATRWSHIPVAAKAHRPLRFLPRSWRAREDGGIVENRLQRVVALDQSIIDFSYR